MRWWPEYNKHLCFSLKLHSLCASGPFPPPALREQSASLSVAVAAEYTRAVRQVEGCLRRQAGKITEEATRLDRQKEKLEKLLRSVRTALLINQKTTDARSRRPATETVSETGWVAKFCFVTGSGMFCQRTLPRTTYFHRVRQYDWHMTSVSLFSYSKAD